MRRRRSLGGGFSPLKLFTSGATGAWYDPSDLTTLFQDSAGATPVTAVEQSVGRILDKSGNNNHATQATAGSQPMLRARYNLLTYSEQFENAAWTKNNVTIATNTLETTDPIGGNTADKVTLSAGTTTKDISVIGLSLTSTVTYSAYFKASTHNFIQILNTGDAQMYANFDFSTGTVGNFGTQTVASITDVGYGWYRITARFIPGTLGTTIRMRAVDSNTAAYGASTSSTGIFYPWGADLRIGSSAETYQRIAAATDYDTVGFAPYLAFDGTADFLGAAYVQSAYPLTLAVGINNDSIAAGNGAFVSVNQSDSVYKVARDNSVGATDAQNRNAVTTTTSGIAQAGNKFVLSQFETSLITQQVNSGTANTIANTNAFGTSANIYLGKARPTNLWSSARIYGVVITNSVLSAAQISSLRSWMGKKMNVTL